MVLHRYRLPPPTYPVGFGFVTPVRASPWRELPPTIHTGPKPPHEDPIGQIPPLIPRDINTSPIVWTNQLQTIPIPRALEDTPIFPPERALPHAWENGEVVDEVPFPHASPNTRGVGAIPMGPPHLEAPAGNRIWVKGTYPPQPWPQPAPIQFNPRLLYNPINAGIPNLEWNIAHRPDSALSYTASHCCVVPDLKQTAVFPDQKKIILESDLPEIRWWMDKWGPIVIQRDDKITIRDMLDCIYQYFQAPLVREEVEEIQNSDSGPEDMNWHTLNYAKHRRAEDAHALYRYEQKRGFKRVDVLGSHRRFKGIRFVVFATNEWKAYLGLLNEPDHVMQRNFHS